MSVCRGSGYESDTFASLRASQYLSMFDIVLHHKAGKEVLESEDDSHGRENDADTRDPLVATGSGSANGFNVLFGELCVDDGLQKRTMTAKAIPADNFPRPRAA